MRPLSLLSLSLVVPFTLNLAACGGDDDPEGVPLDVRGDRAAFLAGREGTDAFKPLTADATGKVAFSVTKPFELIGACEDFGGEIYAYAGGPEDADAEFPYDIGCGNVTTGEITINNTSAASLRVYVGMYYVSVAAGTSSTLEVPTGTKDILILDRTAHQIEVRRGLNVTAGMTIDVDFAAAVALESHPVTLTENATASSWVVTANGRASLNASFDNAVWALPASLRAPGDKSWMAVHEADPTRPTSRFRSATFDPASSAPINLTLPAFMTSATLSWNGVPQATYAAAGEWEERDLFGYQADEDASPIYFFLAYAHAANPAGSLVAPDARALAGWKPAWNVDSATPFNLTLDLSRPTADGGREGLDWNLDTTPVDAKRAVGPVNTVRAERIEQLRDHRMMR